MGPLTTSLKIVIIKFSILETGCGSLWYAVNYSTSTTDTTCGTCNTGGTCTTSGTYEILSREFCEILKRISLRVSRESHWDSQ